MGVASARAVAAELRACLERQSGARMIFAAAPSQLVTLKALCHLPNIDWRRVTAFHMDEYIGLPARAPQRFAHWLESNLFSQLPFAVVHPIRPEPDPATAARVYAERLNEAPIDIVCLGIGVNGHLAFNDPPVADFDDPLDVKIVELDDTCRQQQVDDECFATFSDVPERAITLTIPRLLRAGKMFCVVPGAVKRNAVRATLHGPLTTDCPASILRGQANCTLYLDQESDPDAP
ncbi:6-phosphogluconolactonase [Microvirga alba]|uniref:6-phosphogluconolactonase n=1 Tax=Microvirga alba TaxID=2791025 RepID=A0A931BUJ4_9HYPH|nr:6-phosphogluconolactonase [Microvirga alba]MBF9235395.1 6-phosphogluconolactonase [Microvirga alba]